MSLSISGNVRAFLDTIARSEGTYGVGDDGYNVLVGSTPEHPLLFDSYADHPDVLNQALDSTAAGRYQILHKFWEDYKAQLGLPDFGPESQDRVAIQMIRECRAIDDIEAGNPREALYKCASRWASLPGSDYGQHEQQIGFLLGFYQTRGGTVS